MMPTVRKIANPDDQRPTTNDPRPTNGQVRDAFALPRLLQQERGSGGEGQTPTTDDRRPTTNGHPDNSGPENTHQAWKADDQYLPPGWIKLSLKDFHEVHYGKVLKESNRDPSGAIPVYGSNGVVGQHSSALTEKACVVIGRKGAAGTVHLSKMQCWPIDTTYYVYAPLGVSLEY